MRRAIYAGTFDPLTLGHWWMIQRGAKLFDQLIVAIGENPAKKPMFTVEERKEMITNCLIDPKIGVAARVDSFSNRYLVHYAMQLNAGYIIRGIRSVADLEYEYTMRQVNEDLAPEIETVFLIPPRDVADVSSSLVRGLIGPSNWTAAVKKYVPDPVYRMILAKMVSVVYG
jgi:pantetheine-phosphate adenylyltransferase